MRKQVSPREYFNRTSFITLNNYRLFTAKQVSDLIQQYSEPPQQPNETLADELVESVDAMQGYFNAALRQEESRSRLFLLWKTQRSVIDAQIEKVRGK